MSAHPYLQPLRPSIGQLLSDANPAKAGAVELGDGSVQFIAPGSLPDRLGIKTELLHPTTARSEGSASRSNARNFYEFGAANEPGPQNKIGK